MLRFFMVKIRLSRFGKKRKSVFRIVVINSRKSRDGEYIENLGNYEPTKPALGTGKEKLKLRSNLNIKKYKEWIQKGAYPTEIVARIFSVHSESEFVEEIEPISVEL